MKNWIIILLVFLVPLGVYGFLEFKNPSVKANEAVAAQKTGPKVIKFHSPMCSECKDVQKEMEGLKELYKDIIFEEINVSEQTKQNKNLIKKYKITLVPTLVFVDINGNVVEIEEGFVERSDIIDNIEDIK